MFSFIKHELLKIEPYKSVKTTYCICCRPIANIDFLLSFIVTECLPTHNKLFFKNILLNFELMLLFPQHNLQTVTKNCILTVRTLFLPDLTFKN